MTMLDHSDNSGANGVNDSLDALIKLQTLSADTQLGFQKMVEKSELAFRPIAERFSALHGRHVIRLHNMVREMGGLADQNGSFMGTVNQVVITLRAVFEKVDSDIMDRVRSGENAVFSAFDRAIGASLPKGHRDALIQMKAEITALLDETRRLG